ncbi:hypothetical protein VPHD239_0083 [Vibrio phage D239]
MQSRCVLLSQRTIFCNYYINFYLVKQVKV